MFNSKLKEIVCSFRQEYYIVGDLNTSILAEKNVLKMILTFFLRIFDLKQIIT